jgi:hypothetical protein
MLKSQHKVGDRRLLLSFLTARVYRVQRFRSVFRLCGELGDQRAYKFPIELFLSVVEIEIEIYNCECLV